EESRGHHRHRPRPANTSPTRRLPLKSDAPRKGDFQWSVPSAEQFRFHLDEVRELGRFLCGRKLYETMLPWETDPSRRDDQEQAAFADAWTALP
ncbi:MAG: hypothetical protein KDC17_14350, partial [Actinobacteria bacterium]|nr:hypothetical protein [Actinomycetota bacterium]